MLNNVFTMEVKVFTFGEAQKNTHTHTNYTHKQNVDNDA